MKIHWGDCDFRNRMLYNFNLRFTLCQPNFPQIYLFTYHPCVSAFKLLVIVCQLQTHLSLLSFVKLRQGLCCFTNAASTVTTGRHQAEGEGGRHTFSCSFPLVFCFLFLCYPTILLRACRISFSLQQQVKPIFSFPNTCSANFITTLSETPVTNEPPPTQRVGPRLLDPLL